MNKLENLLSKKGFIYLVDGNYYYLGQWIFKQCTDSYVIGYFEEFRDLLDNSEKNEDRMYYVFRKLMALVILKWSKMINILKLKRKHYLSLMN